MIIRYSNDIVYNNFPWPENPTDKQIKTVEEKAQKVLDVRKEFPNSSLADLYDPLNNAASISKSTSGIRQSCGFMLPSAAIPQRNKTHRVFI